MARKISERGQHCDAREPVDDLLLLELLDQVAKDCGLFLREPGEKVRGAGGHELSLHHHSFASLQVVHLVVVSKTCWKLQCFDEREGRSEQAYSSSDQNT
mmetsp:Transcript_30031/g.77267  ORF Transcript_30031/g.77267 Transcript_30031/m.77267 type:complete len:100 (-) Transcript_30031:26-325(-)